MGDLIIHTFIILTFYYHMKYISLMILTIINNKLARRFISKLNTVMVIYTQV